MIKTNAMRILDSMGIDYEERIYDVDENDLSGVHMSEILGLDPSEVFKTLVLFGDRTGHFVCCIPSNEEIDLKKAAKASGNKTANMIHVKDLKAITGYIRGGCSPIGMKKKFPTFVGETAILYDALYVSAGQRGVSVRIGRDDLLRATDGVIADVTVV